MISAVPPIPGGFVKSWRKEMESEIWLMPPTYHRVWYWLRMNVQHDTFLFPTRERFGIWVLPGQRITSLQQIAEGVKWSEWGREVIPNKKTIKDILDWLIHRGMVTVESNAKGTLISLVNWHSYNTRDTAKVTAESNSQETRSGHKLEVEEVKEVKPSYSDFFESLWKDYPSKDGKKISLRHFTASVNTEADCLRIRKALDNYLAHLKIESWKRPKNGPTWFNNWEDWEHWEEPKPSAQLTLAPANDQVSSHQYVDIEKVMERRYAAQ